MYVEKINRYFLATTAIKMVNNRGGIIMNNNNYTGQKTRNKSRRPNEKLMLPNNSRER